MTVLKAQSSEHLQRTCLELVKVLGDMKYVAVWRQHELYPLVVSLKDDIGVLNSPGGSSYTYGLLHHRGRVKRRKPHHPPGSGRTHSLRQLPPTSATKETETNIPPSSQPLDESPAKYTETSASPVSIWRETNKHTRIQPHQIEGRLGCNGFFFFGPCDLTPVFEQFQRRCRSA